MTAVGEILLFKSVTDDQRTFTIKFCTKEAKPEYTQSPKLWFRIFLFLNANIKLFASHLVHPFFIPAS